MGPVFRPTFPCAAVAGEKPVINSAELVDAVRGALAG